MARSARRGWGRTAAALALAAAVVLGLRQGLAGAHGSRQRVWLEGYSLFGEIIAHGVRARAEAASYRMPLGSLALAALDYHLPAAAYSAALAATGAAFPLLVFALGALLEPELPLLAAAAALLASLMRLPVFFPEAGWCLLVLLCACLAVWRARRPTPRRTAGLAAGLGASLLWRSPMAFFGPLLAAVELARPGAGRSRPRLQALVLCALPYVFVLPWAGFNLVAHGRPLPFERRAADLNVVSGAVGLVQTAEGDASGLTGGAVDPERGGVLRWAAGEVLRHPVRYAVAVARRLAFAAGLHPLLLLAALAGWFFNRRRREHAALAGLALYFAGVHCLMAVEERYFFPLWPLLAPLAAAAAARLAPEAKAEDARRVEAWAGSAVLAALAAAVVACVLADALVLRFAASLARGGAGDLSEQIAAAADGHPADGWLLNERAALRLDAGDMEGAAADYRRLAELRPWNPWSGLRAARAEALLGRPEALLAWTPPPPDPRVPEDPQLDLDAQAYAAGALVALGRETEAQARLSGARELFDARNVLVRGPQGPLERGALKKLRLSDGVFARYVLHAQGARPPKERRALARALTLQLAECRDAWLALAAAELELGSAKDAKAALARAAKASDGDDRGLREAAESYLSLGDAAAADRLLAQVLARAPDDVRAQVDRAQAAAMRGDAPRAARLLAASPAPRAAAPDAPETGRRRAALEAQVSRASARPGWTPTDEDALRRASELYARRALRAAQAALEPLARRHPGDADVWRSLASVYRELGEDRRFLGSLAALRGIKPGALAADELRRLAEDFLALGRPADAASALDEMLARSPSFASAWISRAQASAALKDKAGALKALGRAEALMAADGDAGRSELRRRAALAYQDLGEPRAALAIFTDLSRRRPRDASLLGDKAVCEHLLGDDAAALADSRAAVELEPSFLPAYLTLGTLYEAGGRWSEALALYDRALACPPSAGTDKLRGAVASARREALARSGR